MGQKLLKYTFPYVVAFFMFMLIAVGLTAIDQLNAIIPNTKVLEYFHSVAMPSSTLDVITWFWTVIASLYCGSTALVNLFVTRNISSLDQSTASMPKLRKITFMNYVACIYFFLIGLLGVDMPYEAIISAVGVCTILIILNKKGCSTTIENNKYLDKDGDNVDDRLEQLEKALSDRQASGQFIDTRGDGKDDVATDIEQAIQKRKDEINQQSSNDTN